MSTAQDFLLEVRNIADPKERLNRLEGCALREEPEVRAALAWWHARYYFADKKKNRTADRFVWFLLSLRGWTSTPAADSKQIVSAYKEAFLSPETERAIALDDRLEAEMTDACAIYIQTINPNRVVFGFSMGGVMGKDAILGRIAATVADALLPGVYRACAELRHSDMLIRCICSGAQEVYPGILGIIEIEVQKYDDPRMRDFILSALHG